MARRAPRIDDPDLVAALEKALHRGALSLPDACRSMRARDGLTQAQFAARVGVATKVVKELEGGKGSPTLDALNRIAAFFGLQLTFLRPSTVVKLGTAGEYIQRRQKARRAELRALSQGKSSLKKQHARNALRGSDFTIDL